MKIKEESKLTIDYYGKTDLGLVRSENQDSFGNFPSDSLDIYSSSGKLFIIADGMGGHTKGKEASELAVDLVQHVYLETAGESIPDKLISAFKIANEQIFRIYEGNVQFQKMGTTCTAMVLKDSKAFIAHVGDSRIYKINKEKIEQLTKDHTLVEEMQKKGIINKEEAQNHPEKSVLFRAIGVEKNVDVDIIKNIVLKEGDSYLMCTDGLAKVIPEEIHKIVLENDPKTACEQLVELANERGGKDNVTVQIIKIRLGSSGSPKADTVEKKSVKKWTGRLLLLVVLLLLTFLIIVFWKNIIGIFSSTDKGNEEVENVAEQSKNDNSVGLSLEAKIEKAEYYFSRGKLDSSAFFFKSILESNPVHLASLNGIYRISREYKKIGDEYRSSKNFAEALTAYEKALQLQPDDSQIERLIKICRENLVNSNSDTEYKNVQKTVTRKEQLKKNESTANIYNGQYAKDWIPGDLTSEDCKFISGGAVLYETNKTKKILKSGEMQDIIVEVDAKLNSGMMNGRAGIIIGYNFNDDINSETFFLFSISRLNSFLLQKSVSGNKENLIDVGTDLSEFGAEIQLALKVKCLGPWIMLYANNKFIKAWESKEFVVGKIGLFADPGTLVEFTNFRTSSALEKVTN